jgi:serine/threonine protein kinase
MAIRAGVRFNHYEILSPLGAGGMGEVYLAEDTKLGRKVALKLLPEEFTSDAGRVRRFEQEARAASALNHPNILTIFEIGEANGERYFATEYIDGQTLRDRLNGDRLAPGAALDIAAQIAAALTAAHEAGIVHRDIKPENVMLRRDGIVKVLDFGLAKLTERRADAIDREAPTMAKVNTDPGMVMGTANYMSPEQARGLEVDARSDIFSLGVALYEMLAGRTPFEGVNALDMIGAILNREPAPLSAHTPDSGEAAPAELQRIVMKALRKDRDERYQVVKDMLLDLKSLKQELEFEAKLKGVQAFATPPSGGSVWTREIPPEGGTTNAPTTDAPTTGAQKAQAATNQVSARTTSSAEYIVSQIKQHRTGALITLCVALAIIAGAGYGIYRMAGQKPPVARFEKLKFTRLTTTGKVRSPVISPDGNYVAYINLEGGRRQSPAIGHGYKGFRAVLLAGWEMDCVRGPE